MEWPLFAFPPHRGTFPPSLPTDWTFGGFICASGLLKIVRRFILVRYCVLILRGSLQWLSLLCSGKVCPCSSGRSSPLHAPAPFHPHPLPHVSLVHGRFPSLKLTLQLHAPSPGSLFWFFLPPGTLPSLWGDFPDSRPLCKFLSS